MFPEFLNEKVTVMEKYCNIIGVPDFECIRLKEKASKYCICIPVINEGDRIRKELFRAKKHQIDLLADILLCDGGSTDGSMEVSRLKKMGAAAVLTKKGPGKQGAQLRMGFYYAISKGYEGIITIDGNNKDSIEDVRKFIEKLEEGYDFVQGSRFLPGGRAVRTPWMRYVSVRCIHAPMISKTAGERFTDTTNNFRAYSIKYLTDSRVDIFRDVFSGYELLAYLSVRASQLGMKTVEVPVTRRYPPKAKKTPTKISPVRGNMNLMKILFNNAAGKYHPK